MNPTRTKTQLNKTVDFVDYNTTNNNDESLAYVSYLQDQIEMKESEVTRYRESLGRNDETDMSHAPTELKKLQSAFEQVQKECAAKLSPYEDIYHQKDSVFEGKQNYIDTFTKLSQQKLDSLQSLSQKVDEIIASTIDPPVKINDSQLEPLISNILKIQSDLDSASRSLNLDSYSAGELKNLNDELSKQLKDKLMQKQKSNRRIETLKKDIELKTSNNKPPTIDNEWVSYQQKLQFNTILLRECNSTIKNLNKEIETITKLNLKFNSDISKLREELIELNKFLPNENFSSPIQNFNDASNDYEISIVKLYNSKAKQKVEKTKLYSLQKKLKEIMVKLKEKEKSLEKTKVKQKMAETELEESQKETGEFISEKKFLQNQRDYMKEQINKSKEELKQIKEKTKKLKLILKKQKMIIMLNEEFHAFKNMNLTKVSDTVSNLLKINGEIDKLED
ncbi:hypothetical protein GPJ56_008159 [Histomonas meleagridis]|uniref:uncharacterized protein n=1 Tax=Histomonas meleagridis TaxID=135588 RepID=UPI00355999AC|nr:hypothetical protein GPJ56_008159 [Histomonas meleagridis]KAH0803101.1 hypothetical protein GO595_004194 [Histomonas meleagridis]